MIAQWVEYDGSDEQLYEIMSSKYGFITDDGVHIECVSDCIITDILSVGDKYLLCNPHQLADMICQWARTGQPVWVKEGKSHARPFIYETNTPDWNIPGAEYSFKQFEGEV